MFYLHIQNILFKEEQDKGKNHHTICAKTNKNFIF